MDLLDLFVKIGVKDEASETVDQVSGNLVGKLAKAASTAAKALAGAFVVKKVADFGKAAFDAYASFEQLEGGVAKLYGNANMELDEYLDSMKDSGKSVDELTKTYQRNEKAQKLMMKQASEAWKTAGMDANTYMEQATSMSAALINSLGGDTEEAARQTDVAMRAISDNVNTFGTDMASVSQAFMGFSKQNYTMLDNLKLGYGGTKTEMERLIKDANEWGAANGKASDLSIDSFSDVVTAIEQIQEKQGIAGTTTKEAMTTIEGSMNAAKSAWQNLVTEFGKPDADVSARVGDLFDAVFGVVDDKTKEREGGLFKNITKEVGVIASNMVTVAGDALSQGVDYLFDNGPQLVESAINSVGDAIERGWTKVLDFRTEFNLVDAMFGEDGESGIVGKVTDWFGRMGQAFSDNWPYIEDQLGMLWDELVATAETYGPQLMEVAGRLMTMAGNAIREHGPEIAQKVSQLLQDGLNAVGRLVGMAAAKGAEFIGGLITGSSKEGQKLHQWFADFFPDGLLKGLGDFATFLLDAGGALIDGLLDGIGEVAPDVEEAIRGAFQTVLDWFGKVGDFLADPIGSIKSGLEGLVGSFDDTAESVEKDTSRARGDINKLNGTKLRDKSAKANVSGNAIDGKAKKAVGDTDKAVQNLKGKAVDVDVRQKGLSAGNIDAIRNAISKLKDKNVTVTTHQNTVKSTTVKTADRATGGIRRHARGDIFVADNPGPGVPLDIVGEAGPEAIVPLTSHYGKDFAEMMGKAAAKELGGGGTVVNIYMTYNAGEDAATLVNDVASGLELVLGR